MKTKKIKFSLIITMLLLFVGQLSWAQSTVFTTYETTYSSLTFEQKANYDMMVAQDVFNPEITFMTYNTEAVYDESGVLTFSTGSDLDDYEFKSTMVDATSGADFSWVGEYVSHDTPAIVNHGILRIISHDGRIFGTVQMDHKSYQIYDLTGGVLALAEYRMEDAISGICGNLLEEDRVPTFLSRDCQTNILRVLVIYTGGAANIEPDRWGKALAGINDLNLVWANSLVTNTAHLAGVETVTGLVESSDPAYDVSLFKSNSTVLSLRNAYKADVVVFMTKPTYGSIFGIVPAIGGGFNDAFCISTITHAVSGRRTFAHEVCHLFGARHDSDPTPGYAHGYTFNVGSTKHYTLLASLPSGSSRVPYLSNPNVNYIVIPYAPIPLGTASTNYNAKKVQEYKNQINAYYTDNVPFSVSVLISDIGKCDQYGTATAIIPEECKGPFIYSWSYSDNGFTWYPISGSTPSISTFVPYPLFSTIYGTFNSRQYRVKVTRFSTFPLSSVTGTSTAYYTCPSRPIFPIAASNINLNIDNLTLYPNPFKGDFSLVCNVAEEDNVNMEVIDINGRSIEQIYSGILIKGDNTLKLHSELVPGTYFLKVTGAKTSFTKKIISL